MKRILRFGLTALKWLVLAAVAVEVFCFLIVTASNYLLYGHAFEGSRVHYDPYALFLNDDGPRPTVHNAANRDAPGHLTIWMFGGSTMRSDSGNADTTIPSYLAALLNQPGSPRPCTVLNYGENSFNSLIETKYLQKLLIEAPKPPDLIIFYDGANDSGYFAQYRTPYGHYGFRRLRAAIENYRRSLFGLLKPLNAALYASYTKEAYDKMMQVAVPLKPGDPELRSMVDLTAKRYAHVRKLTGCYGAGFLLVWQPILYVETGQVAPQVREQEQKLAVQGERFLAVRHNFSVVYRALEQNLQDQPYFINFQNVLCPRKTLVYQPDGVHLKAAGNEMVAQGLARVLEERWQEKK
jgi:lysophospholipase L1-like esterase